MFYVLLLFIVHIVVLTVMVLNLIGRKHENRIKSMQVEGDIPELTGVFTAHLKQWGEPRFHLSD